MAEPAALKLSTVRSYLLGRLARVRWSVLLVGLSPCAGAPQTPQPSIEQAGHVANDFADPFVLRDRGAYYAFATNGNGAKLQVARSTDLAAWTALADPLVAFP